MKSLLQYPQLAQYNDITQLLQKSFSIVILLVETDINTGHWVALMRRQNEITFVDSYGLKYDQELRFVSKL